MGGTASKTPNPRDEGSLNAISDSEWDEEFLVRVLNCGEEVGTSQIGINTDH